MTNNTTITINKKDVEKIEQIKKQKKLRNTNDVCEFLLNEYKWSKEKERTAEEKVKVLEEFVKFFFPNSHEVYHFLEDINKEKLCVTKTLLKTYLSKLFRKINEKINWINVVHSDDFNYRRLEWEVERLLKLNNSMVKCIVKDEENKNDFNEIMAEFYYLFRKSLTTIDGVKTRELVKKLNGYEDNFKWDKENCGWSFLDKDYIIDELSELDKLKSENEQLKAQLKELKEKQG